MTKITAIAKKGDKYAFTLNSGKVYNSDVDNIQNKCDSIWLPSVANEPKSDNDGLVAVELVDGNLIASDGFEYYELPSSVSDCQDDAECVSYLDYFSEMKAFFEGHSVGLNNYGQLVASYKGCEAKFTDSII